MLHIQGFEAEGGVKKMFRVHIQRKVKRLFQCILMKCRECVSKKNSYLLKLLHMIEFEFYIGNCRNIRGFRVC